MTDRFESRLRRALRDRAEAEPSPAVDRSVRSMLAAAATRPFLRRGMATGLGSAALLALLAGLSSLLAQAGAAEAGPLLAALAVAGYLALSSAAALPLLVHRRRAVAARIGGAER